MGECLSSNGRKMDEMYLNYSLLEFMLIELANSLYNNAQLKNQVFQIGVKVGLSLVERLSYGKPRIVEPLECIKFVCRDFWNIMYQKQADNLKTNHQGIYVITETNFRPISKMSFMEGDASSEQIQKYMEFHQGCIKGALDCLSLSVDVVSEVKELPAAVFQISVKS